MKKILVIAVAALMLAVMAIPAFAADGDNLALTATGNAPFCSSWEKPEALNDGVVPSASDEATAVAEQVIRYGSWGSARSNNETVAYEWEEAVTVDSVGAFFGYNVTREDWLASGGLHIPASYTIQYWNGSEYVDVTNGSGYGVAADTMNVTTFDAVTTTKIQITFCKVTEAELGEGNYSEDDLAYRGLGIYEIEVYEAGTTGTTEGGETTTAPQTGIATVVLAVVAVLSGAYIVSKKH